MKLSARRFQIVLLAAACLLPLVVSLLFAQRTLHSPNVSSRMDTIQSLVERGTFCIDESLNRFMVDVVKIEGRFYSDKPPLLSVLGAAVYWPLHRLAGLSFRENAGWLYYLLTAILVGLPIPVGLWLFSRTLLRAGLPARTAAVATLLLGAGTMILPYATTFNNHVPAAVAAAAAMYCLFRARDDSARPARWPFVTGLLAGLVFNFDLAPGGMVLAGFGLLFLAGPRGWRDLAAYLAGAFAPIAAYFFLNGLITKDLIPIYLHKEYYDYEGAVLQSYDALKEVYGRSVPTRVFHMLFGYRGFFLYSPILLFGLYEAVRQAVRRAPEGGLAILTLLSVVAVSIVYSIQTPGMAGGSYGMRWLLALTPLPGLFMAFRLESLRRRTVRVAFGAATVLSIVVAAIGVPRPWSSNILSPFTFLDNLAWFAQSLDPPAGPFVYGIVEATSLEKGYAYLEIGRWHMNHGYFTAAISDLEKARRLDPRRADLADYYLGICYSSVGRPDRAVEAYERLLVRQPENTGALNNYARALTELGLPKRALAVYLRSLKLDPDRLLTLTGIADLEERLGMIDEAVAHLKRALKIAPEEIELHLWLADLYLDLGDPDRALRQLRDIRQRRPESEKVRLAIEALTNGDEPSTGPDGR